MRYLSEKDIRMAVSMRDIIEADKQAFVMLQQGKVESPLRTVMNGKHDGTFLIMPAYAPEIETACVKVIDIFPENAKMGLDTSPAQIMLINGKTGYVMACLDGTCVTKLRTGASSGAAFDILAKKHCRKGAVIGTGGQAETQLEAMLTARTLEEVFVYSPDKKQREEFAARMNDRLEMLGARITAAGSSDECIEDADLIITVTTSRTPVFDGTKVRKGATVSCVGTYQPDRREMDPAVLERASKIYCDSVEAALAETGDLLIPIADGIITENDITGSIGDVIDGKIAGRQSDDEIIVYENVGVAALDLVASNTIYRKALLKNIGTEL